MVLPTPRTKPCEAVKNITENTINIAALKYVALDEARKLALEEFIWLCSFLCLNIILNGIHNLTLSMALFLRL